ncbi:vacuolar alkaline phosphatase [Balamuthia mandrillaris]
MTNKKSATANLRLDDDDDEVELQEMEILDEPLDDTEEQTFSSVGDPSTESSLFHSSSSSLLKRHSRSANQRQGGSFFRSRKRFFILCLALFGAICVISASVLAFYYARVLHSPPKPLNLVFMVSDGFGPASVTFAREVSLVAAAAKQAAEEEGKKERKDSDNEATKFFTDPLAEKHRLNLDSGLRGTVQTHSADSFITDSAAGATAYACGLKTYNRGVSVDPLAKQPCGTLMEAARKRGMLTGLVVTSYLSHATPAAFSSHSVDRDLYSFITEQQIEQGIDLMFGGGKKFFTPTLMEKAKAKGYKFIYTSEELRNAPIQTPILGLFADGHMAFEVDRHITQQPSLAEMTEKALHILETVSAGKGFMLLVEGSRIDMAGHKNDPVGHYSDIMAYDETIGVVLEFIGKKETKPTLVVSTSDHSTGGLTLGRKKEDGTYPEYMWSPQVILAVNASSDRMTDQILKENKDIAKVLSSFGVDNPTEAEVNSIKAAVDTLRSNPNDGVEHVPIAIGEVISKRANIAWTTPGHTGVDVNLYSWGTGKETFSEGHWNNHEVGQKLAALFEFDLKAVTKELSSQPPYPPNYQPHQRADDEDEHHPRSYHD